MAESISEGTLKSWLKQPGDTVQADEEVATIETDKVRSYLVTRRHHDASYDITDRRFRQRARCWPHH